MVASTPASAMNASFPVGCRPFMRVSDRIRTADRLDHKPEAGRRISVRQAGEAGALGRELPQKIGPY